MERYLRFILAHRKAVIALTVLLSLLALLSLRNAVIASSLVRLFFGENPEYHEYQRLSKRFGGDELIFIAFEDPQLLEPDGMARLDRIATEIRALPDVQRVDHLGDTQRIRSNGDDLEIDRWSDVLARGSTTAAQEMSSDPLISGLLLGRDRKSAVFLVELTQQIDRPVESMPAIQQQVLACFEHHGLARDRLHVAGLVAETVEITDQARFTLGRIFPITVLLLMVIVYLLFFRLWPVVLTISITGISVLWTFGVAVLIDREINMLLAMAPGIMMIVGFSDVIHMYNAYVASVTAGHHRDEALIHSCAEVGTSSAFTAVTELVGFASLAFVPTPLMRLAGLVLGIGVATTLVMVLTFVPVFLSFIPDGALVSTEAPLRKRIARGLDRFVAATLQISTKKPWLTISFFAAATVVALIGVFRLNVDIDFANRLAPDNHIRISREFFRERFAANQIVEIFVTSKNTVIDPRVAKFQDALLEDPGVDRAFSLIDLLRRLHREISGKDEDLFQVMTPEMAAQYLLLFEVSGGENLDRLVDDSRQQLKITLRIKANRLREARRIGIRAKELAQQHLGPEIEAKPSGVSYLLGDWLIWIVNGQRDGLWFSIVTTLVMMILVLRSFKVGFASMIPNFLPLLFLGGYLGWTRDAVDSDNLIVASIAMGIAVDDTIHFMSRLRRESQRELVIHLALARTSASTGRSILQAALVLCVGFAPFALSEYESTRMMGTLLPMTLAVALFCELLLMPALVVVGFARWKR